MKNGSIGVFDSGIGGLTVVKELIARLPRESFLYLGDTARVPYGTKSPETVLRFSRESAAFLMGKGVKLIVIACNTASAEALYHLREEVSIPIIGVIEPGIRAALQVTKSKRIGVIGTSGTIRSEAYQRGIKNLEPEAEVFALACPLFVPLVEEGWIEKEVTYITAGDYLGVYKDKDIDTLVLGCTHYPLLSNVIRQTVGGGVTLVDSAVETAKEVSRILDGKGWKNGDGGSLNIFLSDISPTFKVVGERFLGRQIVDISLVSL